MIVDALLAFVELFVMVFNFLLIVRVILSYILSPSNTFFAWIIGITEPLLAPVRKLLPPMAGIDLAPLVTFFLLQGVVYLVNALAGS